MTRKRYRYCRHILLTSWGAGITSCITAGLEHWNEFDALEAKRRDIHCIHP